MTNSNTCSGANPGPEATAVEFPSPPDWNGSCVSRDPIPAGTFNAVSMAPFSATECAPVVDVPVPQAEPAWGKFARACGVDDYETCGSTGQRCSSTLTRGVDPGFLRCIMRSEMGADAECPASYPNSYVFYGKYDDSRACSPCQCSQSVESVCFGYTGSYQDANCEVILNLHWRDTDTWDCSMTLDGSKFPWQLQSMKAWLTVDQPGMCEAGGGTPSGKASPTDPQMFCCQPQ